MSDENGTIERLSDGFERERLSVPVRRTRLSDWLLGRVDIGDYSVEEIRMAKKLFDYQCSDITDHFDYASRKLKTQMLVLSRKLLAEYTLNKRESDPQGA